MIKSRVKRMVLAALFLAMAYMLPYLTGQIPEIGSMLCPMHIPVLLCGFICGWQWGLMVGVISPLFRAMITTMPPLFPTAVCMSMELAIYGLMAGLLYRIFPSGKRYIYLALVVAMLTGRVAWGLAMFLCMGLSGGQFGLAAFVAGAFTNAIPGIALQIVAIPPVLILLEQRTKTAPKAA